MNTRLRIKSEPEAVLSPYLYIYIYIYICNPDLFMSSFDIDSLFTNLPLDEAIELCVKKTFKRKRKFKGLTIMEFKMLLEFATKNALIFFNGKYYELIAVGPPLGPTLANVVLRHWEEIWRDKCSKKSKPVYYKR